MTDNNKKFSIGQVVYVLSNRNQTIVPVMIVEEVTVQTLEGKRTSWKFAVGAPSKQKIVESKQLDGEIYSSLEEIKNVLTERLNKFMNQTISNALRQEEAWYGQQIKKAKQAGLIVNDSQKIDPGTLLDNTTNIPANNDNFITQAARELDKEEQKRKLREMLTPDDEDNPEHTNEQNIMTIIENGAKVRVHLPG